MSDRYRGKKRKQAPPPLAEEERTTSISIFWLNKVPFDVVPNIVTYLGSGRMRNIGDEEEYDPEQEQQEDGEVGMDEEGGEEEDDPEQEQQDDDEAGTDEGGVEDDDDDEHGSSDVQDGSGDEHGSSDDDDDEKEEEEASKEDPEERARRLAPDVASLVCLYQAGGKSYRQAIRSLRLKCCGTEFDPCDNLLFTAKRRRLPFGCRDCKFAVCIDCIRFNKCDDCDKPHCWYCNELTLDCCICGKRCCDDCPHSAYKCCQCEESFCEECRAFTCCDECGDTTCIDCPAQFCDECNFLSCLNCPNLMEECVGCDKLLCEDCFRSWTTYCPNEHHKYCDDCDKNHTGGCKKCRERGRFVFSG